MSMRRFSAPPPITIGLPVYNGEDHLHEAIDSILRQTYTDFQLIISDNGSTDATEEICREAASLDKRVRYIRHYSNNGGAWNFNYVANSADSPLFRFAADDDLLTPTLLEECIEMRAQERQAVLWYPRTVEIDADGNDIREFPDSLELRDEYPHRRLREFCDKYENSNALFGLIRHETLMSTRLHGRYRSADIVLLAELALRGRFIEVPKPLFMRRWAERSTAQHRTQDEINQWFDPDQGRYHHWVRTRLFYEMPRCILQAPIPLQERVLSLKEFYSSWIPRHGRGLLGESKQGLLRFAGRVLER